MDRRRPRGRGVGPRRDLGQQAGDRDPRHRWLDGPLVLGLGATQMVLLAITAAVGALTVLPGRATVQEGGVHLVLFVSMRSNVLIFKGVKALAAGQSIPVGAFIGGEVRFDPGSNDISNPEFLVGVFEKVNDEKCGVNEDHSTIWISFVEPTRLLMMATNFSLVASS